MPIKLHCKGMCFAADGRKENCPLPPAFKCNMEKNKGRMISSRKLMLAWKQVVQFRIWADGLPGNWLPLQDPLAKELRVENRQNDKREILPPTVIKIKCQANRPDRILVWHKRSQQVLKENTNRKKLPYLYTKNNFCFQSRWT